MCETDQKKSKNTPRVATGDRAILPEGAKTIPVYIMGKMYEVPETLTIMKAMEFAGFKYNPHAIYHMMAEIMPVYHDFNLKSRGVQYIYPELAGYL